MPGRRPVLLIVLAALACGAGTAAMILASDHLDNTTVWAVFGPAVGWSFIGTGLYAQRRRPESQVPTTNRASLTR